MQEREWRVTATFEFPKLVVAAAPPAPGSCLPEKIAFQSRLQTTQTVHIDGLGDVRLVPNPHPLMQQQVGNNLDLVALSLRRFEQSAELALTAIESPLELLLDDISFQLQFGVRVLMLEVLDVTPPLILGDDRETLLYPFPLGWPYPKFQEGVFLGDSVTPGEPVLRKWSGLEDPKTRAALRWYVKSLATPFDVDRFAFLWIALEILCSANASIVERPYVNRCGHEIGLCPTCGVTTTKGVQGATLKAFLEQEVGIAKSAAIELWQTRQMFHGSNDLTRAAAANLANSLLILRHAVTQALKKAANLPLEALPQVNPQGVVVGREMALGGTRKVDATDLTF